MVSDLTPVQRLNFLHNLHCNVQQTTLYLPFYFMNKYLKPVSTKGISSLAAIIKFSNKQLTRRTSHHKFGLLSLGRLT